MKKIESGDGAVRFVERGFKTGEMSIQDFLKHPYLLAQVGEDMVDVVERVANQCNKAKVWIYGIDQAEQDRRRYTSLCDYHGRLDVNGGYFDVGRNGYAFGVLNTGEGTSKN
jgi:hypothetical protein